MQAAALRPGRPIPHFEVTTLDGHRARYTDLWQRRNLVLVTLPRSAGPAAHAYLGELQQRLSGLKPDDTTLVACETSAASTGEPMLVICDRWGEIAHVRPLSADVGTWPAADDILEWVQFVRMQCPECPP